MVHDCGDMGKLEHRVMPRGYLAAGPRIGNELAVAAGTPRPRVTDLDMPTTLACRAPAT